ncbi:hypothetical protein [Brevibacillus migulae]|uniref:hypothetical protein n=1 Tax=Brevibacillus migulae TaxID=1644114 RepID=UPI00106E2E62|nr:hypothetical protein [Brevibacillus migulae]
MINRVKFLGKVNEAKTTAKKRNVTLHADAEIKPDAIAILYTLQKSDVEIFVSEMGKPMEQCVVVGKIQEIKLGNKNTVKLELPRDLDDAEFMKIASLSLVNTNVDVEIGTSQLEMDLSTGADKPATAYTVEGDGTVSNVIAAFQEAADVAANQG